MISLVNSINWNQAEAQLFLYWDFIEPIFKIDSAIFILDEDVVIIINNELQKHLHR